MNKEAILEQICKKAFLTTPKSPVPKWLGSLGKISGKHPPTSGYSSIEINDFGDPLFVIHLNGYESLEYVEESEGAKCF